MLNELLIFKCVLLQQSCPMPVSRCRFMRPLSETIENSWKIDLRSSPFAVP